MKIQYNKEEFYNQSTQPFYMNEHYATFLYFVLALQ